MNVALLASSIFSLNGFFSSRSLSSFLNSMHALIAQPQSGEWCRCSEAGISFSSQPSRFFWHRKQETLSGVDAVGL